MCVKHSFDKHRRVISVYVYELKLPLSVVYILYELIPLYKNALSQKKFSKQPDRFVYIDEGDIFVNTIAKQAEMCFSGSYGFVVGI